MNNEIMPHTMSRGAQDDILREALRRVDGAPTPHLEPMQILLGREGRIRAAHDVIRTYLDEHDLADTKAWAQRLDASAQHKTAAD